MRYNSIHFYFFLSFIAGIFLGAKKIVYVALIPALSILLLLLMLLCIRHKKETLFTACLCTFLIFLGALHQAPHTAYSLDRFLSGEHTYSFSVASIPKETNRLKTYFAIIDAIDSVPFQARVYVKDFTKDPVVYRAMYEVRAAVSRHTYNGRLFYTLWIKQGARRTAQECSLVVTAMRTTSLFLIRYFKAHLTLDAYQFLGSVLLGRRELLPYTVRSVFIDAGVAHLLAISGLHVGLLGVIVLFVLKLFRIPYRARLFLSVAFLILYTYISGAAASTVRACIMYTLFCASFLFKKRMHPLNSLGLAGLVSLMINPLWVFTIGFQFSFLSVTALIIGSRIFPFIHSRDNCMWAYTVNIVKASAIVTVTLFPLSLFYFGRATLFGIVSNVVLIPLFTLVLAVSFVFLSCIIFGACADLIGGALSVLVFVFLKVVSLLSEYRLFSFSFSLNFKNLVFCYCLLALLIFIVFYIKQRPERDQI